jgi:hypothetical protein
LGASVLQQHRHGPRRLELARADRLAVTGVGDDDLAQALGQIAEVRRQAEDRHDL